MRTPGLPTLGPVFWTSYDYHGLGCDSSGRNVLTLRGRYCFLQGTLSPNDGRRSHLAYGGNTALRMAVAQLVEVLRYKPEGRGFDFRWCHWNFFLLT